MLFSTICLYAVIWGASSVFGGLTSPIIPTIFKKVTRKVTKAAKEVSIDVYKFRYGEGIFDHDRQLILLERYPFLVEYESPELEPLLGISFWITKEEEDELKMLILPLQNLEYTGAQLDEVFLHVQRRISLAPVLEFLGKIPETRRDPLV